MCAETLSPDVLAIEGGVPTLPHSLPPMYPGGNQLDAREEQAVVEVVRRKRLFRYYGPGDTASQVDALEKAFAAKMGASYALAVTSGTAALICALQGIGVGPGDEVIVPAYTWISTAAAVLAVGAIPVVAEVDTSLTLDPADLPERLSPYTRAIIPVHMRGVPCQMDALLAFAQQHGLKVVEDVAQANGASYRGRPLGTFADAGCFSLQFNKIITAGEGGLVITNDAQVWKRALMFHDVIGGLRNEFPREDMLWGINFRMPELLAAVAVVQLERLDGLLDAMRSYKQILQTAIQPLAAEKGLQLQTVPDPQGDAGIAFIFFAHDAGQAMQMVKAISAENVPAYTLYDPQEVDYHVYTHWTPIVEKRAWTRAGAPWTWAPRQVDYSPRACPRTLDLLSRAVHIDVNPLLSSADIEMTVEALEKVIRRYA